MPELPEVETITRILRQGNPHQPSLIGLTIKNVVVNWPRSIAEPSMFELLSRLPGQEIVQIYRRAKYLVFQLNQDVLIIHLRMSGDLRVEKGADFFGVLLPHEKHDRVVFNLEQGWRLAFNDARKFGRVWLVGNPNCVLGHLGPEPLSSELTDDAFFLRLQSRHSRIKPLLMDQRFLSGMGNIYTDEALYLARLHPARLSDQVTKEEAVRLLDSVRQVLQEGILHNGSSIDWVYRGGGFQNQFRVYQKTGQPCSVCGNPIQRMVIAQRGTHFCATCQPLSDE